MNKVYTALIGANFMFSIAMLMWLMFAVLTSFAGASSRIAVLDRENIINNDELRKALPSLAQNPRRDLGPWVARRERRMSYEALGAGALAGFVNTTVLLIVRRKQRRYFESREGEGK